jgi:exodeoxyribonuclease VII small subunit
MAATKGQKGSDLSNLSYGDATAELDAIVNYFESSEIDVDQLVSQLERATALIEELDTRLRRTRTQVETLVPKLAAAIGDGVEETATQDYETQITDLTEETEADEDSPGLF